MTKVSKRTFVKASKVVDKPSNVKIDIRLCTSRLNVCVVPMFYHIKSMCALSYIVMYVLCLPYCSYIAIVV